VGKPIETAEPLKVGIIGCGAIIAQYLTNFRRLDQIELVAVADLDPARAQAVADDYDGVRAVSVDELLAADDVDLVLNLTIPAAHAAVALKAIAAGKSVYGEKPLAATTAEARQVLAAAREAGVVVGCAPDTVLGTGIQTARKAIDDGLIGAPISATATMVTPGHERWHPNPDFYYQPGGGPLLDMGPYYLTAIVALLGPVARVAGLASTRVLERRIEIGPRAGERFVAETPTHTAALLELASGVTVNLVASFEAPDQYVCDLVVHGTQGMLALPDPNAFEGPIRLRDGRQGWSEVPYETRGGRDARGIGLLDLAEAIADGRPHRASGELARHVVDVARTILAAARKGKTLDVATTVERPPAMPPVLVRERR